MNRLAFLLVLPMLAACRDERYEALTGDAKAGWEVFRVHCLLCHTDPQRDTPTGPALAGANSELLRAKVLEARYPEGYTPRRPGAITMPPQPQVKDKLELLAAFLGALPVTPR